MDGSSHSNSTRSYRNIELPLEEMSPGFDNHRPEQASYLNRGSAHPYRSISPVQHSSSGYVENNSQRVMSNSCQLTIPFPYPHEGTSEPRYGPAAETSQPFIFLDECLYSPIHNSVKIQEKSELPPLTFVEGGESGKLEKESDGQITKTVEKNKTPKAIPDRRKIYAFKSRLTELIKILLKPKWKLGKISLKTHKTIAKKAADKVVGSVLASSQLPQTQRDIDQYLSDSEQDISDLVQAYLKIYEKLNGKICCHGWWRSISILCASGTFLLLVEVARAHLQPRMVRKIL